jgi:hypothetical protein
MNFLRLVLVAVLLGGCAPLNINLDYSLANKPGKGVVVMSMTYTPDAPTFGLNFRPLGGKEPDAIMSNTLPHPEDWKNPAGRLVVLELPVGKYEIFEWFGNWLESKRPFSVPFTVVEGRATYIGNVRVDVLRELGTFRVSVTDKSDRDISLLLSRFKNIKSADIEKSISTVNSP